MTKSSSVELMQPLCLFSCAGKSAVLSVCTRCKRFPHRVKLMLQPLQNTLLGRWAWINGSHQMKGKNDLIWCVVVLMWREFKASRFPHSVNTEHCRPAFLSGCGLPSMVIFIMAGWIKGECTNKIKHSFSFHLSSFQGLPVWPILTNIFLPYLY